MKFLITDVALTRSDTCLNACVNGAVLEIPRRSAMNLCNWQVSTSRCSKGTRLLSLTPQLSHDNYWTIDLFQTDLSRAHYCTLHHSINQSSLIIYEFYLLVRVSGGWPFDHLLCADWCISFCQKQGRTKQQRTQYLKLLASYRPEYLQN